MVLLAVCACAPAGAQQIPPVHATALSGDRIDLPEAFRGRAAVLVLGFSQASRDQVTAWGKRLAADYRESNSIVYFEMPILESVPRLLRGWVTKKMGESVPDRARATFLPVSDHEAEWKAAANFNKAGDAYVLVVDKTGAVRGRVEGAANDASYAEMKRLLETAR
jgi:hypothetical protein